MSTVCNQGRKEVLEGLDDLGLSPWKLEVALDEEQN